MVRRWEGHKASPYPLRTKQQNKNHLAELVNKFPSLTLVAHTRDASKTDSPSPGAHHNTYHRIPSETVQVRASVV